LEQGLRVLDDIRHEFGFPILSDIHYPEQVDSAAEVLDVIQIPAFLCMQTDLNEKIALSKRPVNIKHGQFLAPENMSKPVEKIERMGNDRIIVTERGYAFGYNDLIVDPRSFYLLRQIGYPVVFDVPHSVRRYGIPSADPKGGNREYLPVLGRAAVGAGIDGLFIETHPNPSEALCDAASQMLLDDLEEYLKPLLEINAIVKGV
jgi:2-dehydro-3-deoxyphosphooctonate aldolase (KDO 8-P synthase)